MAQARDGLLAQTAGTPPHRAILGCTHYPLVEQLFRRHLPPFTRLLSQPEVVADSLEDYLHRHPRYRRRAGGRRAARPADHGRAGAVDRMARIFWPEPPPSITCHIEAGDDCRIGRAFRWGRP